MRIVITGGAGFIGKKLARALLARGTLMDRAGTVQSIRTITLFDVVEAEALADDPRLETIAGDITDPDAVKALIGPRTDGVFHLAAIVGANAEEDFDLGYRVNLDGTRHVLEACRALPEAIKLVFASSVAVYGGDMPAVLDDGTILTPRPPTAARRPRASCCSTTTAARAWSTAARSACRRSWSAPAGRTRRPRPSRARSSASRSPARPRSARSSATPRCTSSRRAG